MSGTISAEDLAAALCGTADALEQARDELCLLDAAAGDGDLGATLAMGFAHVRAALGADGFDRTDSGTVLVEAGSVLARRAPSTMGALLATAFMRAGGTVKGVARVDGPRIAALLAAATEGVAERGGVTTGQRTIVDAMDPAACEATAAAAEGADPAAVLRRAAEGARRGARATAEMEPVVGRAGWIADRARGRPDAGATAWAIILEGLADHLEQ